MLAAEMARDGRPVAAIVAALEAARSRVTTIAALDTLEFLRRGGRVVCAGIHMSDIPSFPYEILWGEREVVSVANLTRRDGEEFLPLAASIPIETTVHRYPLEQANEALDDLREGRFSGAAVLVP